MRILFTMPCHAIAWVKSASWAVDPWAPVPGGGSHKNPGYGPSARRAAAPVPVFLQNRAGLGSNQTRRDQTERDTRRALMLGQVATEIAHRESGEKMTSMV